jgi:hypothetical protein
VETPANGGSSAVIPVGRKFSPEARLARDRNYTKSYVSAFSAALLAYFPWGPSSCSIRSN